MVGTLVLPNGYVANPEGKRNAAGRQIGSVSERETLIGFLEKPPPKAKLGGQAAQKYNNPAKSTITPIRLAAST
jgi:hypothetical protein